MMFLDIAEPDYLLSKFKLGGGFFSLHSVPRINMQGTGCSISGGVPRQRHIPMSVATSPSQDFPKSPRKSP